MANFYTAIRDTIAAYGWTGTDAEILALGNEPYYAAGDGTKTAVPTYQNISPTKGVGVLERRVVAFELQTFCSGAQAGTLDPAPSDETCKAADAFYRMTTFHSRVEYLEYSDDHDRAVMDGMIDLLVAEDRIPAFTQAVGDELKELGMRQETVWVRTCGKTPTESDIKYARTLPAAQKVA